MNNLLIGERKLFPLRRVDSLLAPTNDWKSVSKTLKPFSAFDLPEKGTIRKYRLKAVISAKEELNKVSNESLGQVNVKFKLVRHADPIFTFDIQEKWFTHSTTVYSDWYMFGDGGSAAILSQDGYCFIKSFTLHKFDINVVSLVLEAHNFIVDFRVRSLVTSKTLYPTAEGVDALIIHHNSSDRTPLDKRWVELPPIKRPFQGFLPPKTGHLRKFRLQVLYYDDGANTGRSSVENIHISLNIPGFKYFVLPTTASDEDTNAMWYSEWIQFGNGLVDSIYDGDLKMTYRGAFVRCRRGVIYQLALEAHDFPQGGVEPVKPQYSEKVIYPLDSHSEELTADWLHMTTLTSPFSFDFPSLVDGLIRKYRMRIDYQMLEENDNSQSKQTLQLRMFLRKHEPMFEVDIDSSASMAYSNFVRLSYDSVPEKQVVVDDAELEGRVLPSSLDHYFPSLQISKIVLEAHDVVSEPPSSNLLMGLIGGVYGFLRLGIFVPALLNLVMAVAFGFVPPMTHCWQCNDTSLIYATSVTSSQWIVACGFLRVFLECFCSLCLLGDSAVTMASILRGQAGNYSFLSLFRMPRYITRILLLCIGGSSYFCAGEHFLTQYWLPQLALLYRGSVYLMLACGIILLAVSNLPVFRRLPYNEDDSLHTNGNEQWDHRNVWFPDAEIPLTHKQNIFTRLSKAALFSALIVPLIVTVSGLVTISNGDHVALCGNEYLRTLVSHFLHMVLIVCTAIVLSLQIARPDTSTFPWFMKVSLVYLAMVSIAPGYNLVSAEAMVISASFFAIVLLVCTLIPALITIKDTLNRENAVAELTKISYFCLNFLSWAKIFRILNIISVISGIASLIFAGLAPTVNWFDIKFDLDNNTQKLVEPIYALEDTVQEITDDFQNFIRIIDDSFGSIVDSCPAYISAVLVSLALGAWGTPSSIALKLAKFITSMAKKLSKYRSILLKLKNAITKLASALKAARKSLVFAASVENFYFFGFMLPPVITGLVLIFIAFWPRRMPSDGKTLFKLRRSLMLGVVLTLTFFNTVGLVIFEFYPRMLIFMANQLPLIQATLQLDVGWTLVELAYTFALVASGILLIMCMSAFCSEKDIISISQRIRGKMIKPEKTKGKESAGKVEHIEMESVDKEEEKPIDDLKVTHQQEPEVMAARKSQTPDNRESTDNIGVVELKSAQSLEPEVTAAKQKLDADTSPKSKLPTSSSAYHLTATVSPQTANSSTTNKKTSDLKSKKRRFSHYKSRSRKYLRKSKGRLVSEKEKRWRMYKDLSKNNQSVSSNGWILSLLLSGLALALAIYASTFKWLTFDPAFKTALTSSMSTVQVHTDNVTPLRQDVNADKDLCDVISASTRFLIQDVIGGFLKDSFGALLEDVLNALESFVTSLKPVDFPNIIGLVFIIPPALSTLLVLIGFTCSLKLQSRVLMSAGDVADGLAKLAIVTVFIGLSLTLGLLKLFQGVDFPFFTLNAAIGDGFLLSLAAQFIFISIWVQLHVEMMFPLDYKKISSWKEEFSGRTCVKSVKKLRWPWTTRPNMYT